MLPEDTLDFLRNQDFGVSFDNGRKGGVFELASWEGNRHQFHDAPLQLKWKKVHNHLKAFSNELALSTGPIGGGPLFTAHPDHGDRDNSKDWVQEKIDALNEKSSSLADAVDEFEPFARRRLKL